MTSLDIFRNYSDVLAQWTNQHQMPSNGDHQKMNKTDTKTEPILVPDKHSVKIECDYPISSISIENDYVNISNNIGLSVKENGYDIKNVLNIDNNEDSVINTSITETNGTSKKIKCFCEEEFVNILELISHLKTCQQSREIKWNPFLKWATDSFESFSVDEHSGKCRSVGSSASEALDLSKKSLMNDFIEPLMKVQNLMETKMDVVKLHCPECKFICSNKTLLLEHFDFEHKESGSFSCTCGHINDWLPSFLRHYIVCKIAATDLQEEQKDELGSQTELNSQNFDNDFINKSPASHANLSKLYNNRWDLPFGFLSGLSHQFINGWVEPCKLDYSLLFQNKCPWCQRSFSNLTEASNHISQCNIKPLLKSFDKPFGMDMLKSPNLPFSHSSIPISPFSERHLAMTSTSINGPPPEISRHFKCSHCIKSFKSKALLDQHMHIHYPPKYTCKYCGKKYRWPPVFYHHQRTCKKRPALLNSTASSSASSTAYLSSLSTTHSTITSSTSTSSYLGITSNLSNSIHSEISVSSHSQNKASPPNLIMNGTNAFMQHPLINFPTKLSFQLSYQGNNGFSCICGQRIDNFTSYLTHINYCPIFIHMSSKQCSENPPVPPLNTPLNPLNFKSVNAAGLDHNPFLHPNGLLLRPPIQSPYFNPNLHQSALKPKASPPITNQPISISSAFLPSADSIMVAYASPLNSQKSSTFLSDAFPMNLNYNNISTSNSNASPNLSLPTNNNCLKDSLLPSINSFDRLLSHEMAQLPLQTSPPFNPSIHPHHHYFGIGKSCNQCGKEFSSRLSLKQHIEGKHSMEGKYQCPSCSKRYRWGASYYYHKKSCIASKDSTSSPNPSPTMTEMIFD